MILLLFNQVINVNTFRRIALVQLCHFLSHWGLLLWRSRVLNWTVDVCFWAENVFVLLYIKFLHWLLSLDWTYDETSLHGIRRPQGCQPLQALLPHGRIVVLSMIRKRAGHVFRGIDAILFLELKDVRTDDLLAVVIKIVLRLLYRIWLTHAKWAIRIRIQICVWQIYDIPRLSRWWELGQIARHSWIRKLCLPGVSKIADFVFLYRILGIGDNPVVTVLGHEILFAFETVSKLSFYWALFQFFWSFVLLWFLLS